MKNIYIVLSQTGTALSRILKLITGAKYNHASISLDVTLRELYAFGRVNPMNPVIGGFVKESRVGGTFRRFPETEIIVLRKQVPDEVYDEMSHFLESMYIRRGEYGYNYFGLFFAAAQIHFEQSNHFYCSEFVRHVLLRFNMTEASYLPEIVKPVDFLCMKGWEPVYSGKMKSYRIPLKVANRRLAGKGVKL